jgi:molecular chaperone HtpG
MEMKLEKVQFVRVDADIADNLVDKAESNESVLTLEQSNQLVDLFKGKLSNSTAVVEVKGLSTDAAPVIATRPEWSRRMKDMAQASGGGGMMGFYASMPDEVNFTLNGNHPIHSQILAEDNEAKQEKLVRNLLDLALLSQGMLKGSDLTEFITRSVALMEQPNTPVASEA